MIERRMEILRERLLANREIDENGCWLWIRSTVHNGYGQTSMPLNGKHREMRVHRVAAWLWKGFDIESDTLILHHCDQRRCFNPEHLYEGTPAQNSADMVARGRSTKGRPPRNKLSDEVIERIHDLHAWGTPPRRIARLVGCSSQTVYVRLRAL